MNLLCKSARIYRHNVVHLRVHQPTSRSSLASSRRALSTGQWKKYLNILDVNKDSSTKDIKDSFLRLSKVYHPDNKTTGSHAKFVELKEAYDALKDGHPTTSDSSSTYSGAYRYNNYYNTDMSYETHRAQRDRYRNYAYGQSHYGFGGPYRDSSTPWEDLRRDREYRRQQQQNAYAKFGGRGLMNMTILLSAMAWVVIYSSVLLIWDYNDAVKKDYFGTRHRDDYLQYQEYLKRKEAARATRELAMKDPKYKLNDDKPKGSYITSNNQRFLTAVPTRTAPPSSADGPSVTPPPPPPSSSASLKSTPIMLEPNISSSDPEVVGAL